MRVDLALLNELYADMEAKRRATNSTLHASQADYEAATEAYYRARSLFAHRVRDAFPALAEELERLQRALEELRGLLGLELNQIDDTDDWAYCWARLSKEGPSRKLMAEEFPGVISYLREKAAAEPLSGGGA